MLAVVYLIFNEGYGGRGDLNTEAIRLGRALAELMPDEPEVLGLLALMLLLDARRAARFRDGELVLLAEQDRSLWDGGRSPGAGKSSTGRSRLRGSGPYVVQAAIASLHAEEPRDWPQIAALYGELARLTGSPVVELNRAVAVAEAEGPEAGLAIVERLPLGGLPLPALDPRPTCCSGSGRTAEAGGAYRRALELDPTEPSGGCSSASSPSSRAPALERFLEHALEQLEQAQPVPLGRRLVVRPHIGLRPAMRRAHVQLGRVPDVRLGQHLGQLRHLLGRHRPVVVCVADVELGRRLHRGQVRAVLLVGRQVAAVEARGRASRRRGTRPPSAG